MHRLFGYEEDEITSTRSIISAHESDADEVSRTSLSADGKESRFNEKYDIQDTLGKGVASTVRRCVEKKTGEHYAVKIVDVTTGHQTESERVQLMQETLDEVQLLRQLAGKSAAIIELHDFYKTPTYLFLVCELLPLGELFDTLTKEVTFSEKRTKRVMRQILDAVRIMHQEDIVHRDIKLENILCKSADEIKLTDFGFAVKATKEEKLKELKGTPGYLAPETIKCQYYEAAAGYNREVDLWACGVIMYTLLAGYAPFYHRRQNLMLRQIMEGRYQMQGELWASVSADAKDMLSGLLQVEPSARLTAEQALRHPFMTAGRAEVVPKSAPKDRFRCAVWCVRFLLRLQKMHELNKQIDRAELRKRPFKDRQIRHEAETAMFAVYGHWVNKGIVESRDQLFANRPKPKRARKSRAHSGGAPSPVTA